jgi:ABC-type nitrate/sulfonate/bicarbonate transport system substrate-binding protein
LTSGLKAIARYDELGDCPPSLVVATKGWATENQNAVRFIRALTKSHHWLYDAANRSETEALLRKYTKVDADIAHDVYEMLFVTDKVYSRDGSIDLKGLKNAFQLIAEAGEVTASKLPAPESIVLPKELGGVMH